MIDRSLLTELEYFLLYDVLQIGRPYGTKESSLYICTKWQQGYLNTKTEKADIKKIYRRLRTPRRGQRAPVFWVWPVCSIINSNQNCSTVGATYAIDVLSM